MKGLLPKSLVGQLLLVVALLLLAAQAVNMFLLYRGAQRQNQIEASAHAVARISGALHRGNGEGFERPRGLGRFRRAQPHISSTSTVPERAARIAELESRAAQAFVNMGFPVEEVEAARVRNLPETLTGSIVGAHQMRSRRRMIDRQFSARRPDRKVTGYIILSVQGADDRWISIASAVREGNPHLIRTLLFQTAVLYLILLIPLIWLGRYISKPLKALTARAKLARPGEKKPLEESGPPDTRQLISAFNAMNERVGAMLDEKDVMLGAIGHDLRTPLAALRVRVESVEDETERQRMIAGIEDMDRTLDDILSLARLGRSGEQAEPTDINALIETIVDEFTDLDENVTFERGERATAPIRATLIRRALRNLISNAVKYGEAANIAVDKTVDSLVINIDDIGPGIAPDQIDAMFEPFVRAEKSRNRATGGSGLGLTLARSIARDHGGDVTLENREEGGLRAILTLPAS